jgi:hypothetical protein
MVLPPLALSIACCIVAHGLPELPSPVVSLPPSSTYHVVVVVEVVVPVVALTEIASMAIKLNIRVKVTIKVKNVFFMIPPSPWK